MNLKEKLMKTVLVLKSNPYSALIKSNLLSIWQGKS